jgi:DNA replication and repair protein RecF
VLNSLELNGFRNYARLSLPLGQRRHVLVGANGQGKTNLLEAIFFLATLRSFRTTALRDLCGAGMGGSFRIVGEIQRPDQAWTRRLDVLYGERRHLQVDGSPVRTTGEFIGEFRVVAFTPDDLRLVHGPAALRRRFLDMVLATADPGYLHALQEYAAALKARNAALRSAQPALRQAAAAFTPILARGGTALVVARRSLVAALGPAMEERIRRILGRQAEFSLRHQTQARSDDPAAFAERLAADLDKDRERGYTGYGPHLDDLVMTLDGHDLRHHGSTGQCRLAALAMKMAIVQWYHHQDMGPHRDLVVLVDDVTGELDAPTREAFLADLHAADQLFATFTEPPTGPEPFPDAVHMHVQGGEVSALLT